LELGGGSYQLSARANTIGQCLVSMNWRLGISTTTNSNDIFLHSDSEQHLLTIATSTYTGVFTSFTLPAGSYNVFILPLCNDNTGDGMLLQTNSLQTRFTGFITDSGGYTPPVPPYPHITSLTYATSTGYANITGYWEATSSAYIDQRLSFWQFSNQFGKEDYVQVIASSTGYFNFSFPFRGSYYTTTGTTTAPLLTSFTLNASLDQYDSNYYDPFGQLGLDTSKYITNLDATSTTISGFNYGQNDFSTSTRALALYPEYDCSLASLTGCIKNAIIWAFYPTQEVIDNWNSLLITIQSKAPIGYFFMIRDNLSGLSATSTPQAFSVVIPSSIKKYIFNPFDIGISAILWFFFIFNFYKRLKTITI
jgi:hypothetical protein